MNTIKGIRIDRPDDSIPQPGEYGKDSNGDWQCCPPDHPEHLGSLRNHTVIENEDGTITVSPSILITHWKEGQWHGYLENGVWREI